MSHFTFVSKKGDFNKRKWQHDYMVERRAIQREFVARAKSQPCADCWVQYEPWVMQFDHRNPADKKFELSAITGTRSTTAIEIEIAKCDVVCANCHAERTHKQRIGSHAI